MERPSDERFDIPRVEDGDAWIRYLESNGAVTPLGEPDDPCKIIGISESLWRLGRLVERNSGSQGAAGSGEQIHRPVSSQPPSPAEFIEELKRNFRERPSVLWVVHVAVPIELRLIARQVQRSRSIVEGNETDPDDEPEIYQHRTWERAARFILRASIAFWRTKSISPPMPLIMGGPDGSIDIVWRFENRALYMNIPEEPDTVVTFFGTDQEHADSRLRGEEPLVNSAEWLLAWLVR